MLHRRFLRLAKLSRICSLPAASPASSWAARPPAESVARAGLGRSAFNAIITDGILPKPVKLGCASAWSEHELDSVVAAMIRGDSQDALRDLVQRLHDERARWRCDAAVLAQASVMARFPRRCPPLATPRLQGMHPSVCSGLRPVLARLRGGLPSAVRGESRHTGLGLESAWAGACSAPGTACSGGAGERPRRQLLTLASVAGACDVIEPARDHQGVVRTRRPPDRALQRRAATIDQLPAFVGRSDRGRTTLRGRGTQFPAGR